MSEVRQVTRYFQKCDFCGEDIELADAKCELKKVCLPATYYSQTELSKKPSLVWVSVCDDCLDKLKLLIDSKWKVEEFEYGGVTVKEVKE